MIDFPLCRHHLRFFGSGKTCGCRIIPPLTWAAGQGTILPVYIWDEETSGLRAMGAAQKWWLHHSLIQLQKSLAHHGLPLILRRGKVADILAALIQETGPKP